MKRSLTKIAGFGGAVVESVSNLEELNRSDTFGPQNTTPIIVE